MKRISLVIFSALSVTMQSPIRAGDIATLITTFQPLVPEQHQETIGNVAKAVAKGELLPTSIKTFLDKVHPVSDLSQCSQQTTAEIKQNSRCQRANCSSKESCKAMFFLSVEPLVRSMSDVIIGKKVPEGIDIGLLPLVVQFLPGHINFKGEKVATIEKSVRGQLESLLQLATMRLEATFASLKLISLLIDPSALRKATDITPAQKEALASAVVPLPDEEEVPLDDFD